jgi:antitoxin ParD1/3/4
VGQVTGKRLRCCLVGIVIERLVAPVATQYIRPMAQMHVLLPDDLQSWTEARVAQGRYGSTSDYMRDLVRRDRDDAEKLNALRAAIHAGLASGVSERTIEDIIADRRERDSLA